MLKKIVMLSLLIIYRNIEDIIAEKGGKVTRVLSDGIQFVPDTDQQQSKNDSCVKGKIGENFINLLPLVSSFWRFATIFFFKWKPYCVCGWVHILVKEVVISLL